MRHGRWVGKPRFVSDAPQSGRSPLSGQGRFFYLGCRSGAPERASYKMDVDEEGADLEPGAILDVGQRAGSGHMEGNMCVDDRHEDALKEEESPDGAHLE